MELTVLGSGTSVPQSDRSAPGYFIGTDSGSILLDLGPGTIWNLARLVGIGPGAVNGVLLSHLHLDHCSDLASLLFSMRSPEIDRDSPLRVLGPAGLKDYYGSLRGIYGHWVEPAGYDLLLEEWDGDIREWEGFRISAAPTIHSIPNIAFLVQDMESGSRCLYTGDGEPTEELVGLAGSGIEVLVAESSLAPGIEEENHMNPAQAAGLATRCMTRKLILTHLNPGCRPDDVYQDAVGHFEGEIVIASDGMTISF